MNEHFACILQKNPDFEQGFHWTPQNIIRLSSENRFGAQQLACCPSWCTPGCRSWGIARRTLRRGRGWRSCTPWGSCSRWRGGRWRGWRRWQTGPAASWSGTWQSSLNRWTRHCLDTSSTRGTSARWVRSWTWSSRSTWTRGPPCWGSQRRWCGRPRPTWGQRQVRGWHVTRDTWLTWPRTRRWGAWCRGGWRAAWTGGSTSSSAGRTESRSSQWTWRRSTTRSCPARTARHRSLLSLYC